MHASDQSNFGRLPFGFESFVEVPNDGVKTGGNQSGHEQSAAYRGSASPDGATAFESSAVTGEGSHADQSRYLFAAEGAELWEFSDADASGQKMALGFHVGVVGSF